MNKPDDLFDDDGPDAPELDPGPGDSRSQQVFMPGDLVAERYCIIRPVARGGMGLVYEAEDTELGGRVALKALRPEIALHTTNLARFRREIHLARRVTHPNICRLYDVGQHIDPHRAIRFLTMELLHGETLSRLVEREAPLPPARALPIVSQILSGLAAAHEAGVVHRDFKPSNVLLVDTARGPRVVVTDFGLSASIDEGQDPARLTATGQLMGTLAYLAPEQLEGKPCTPVSDLYAFGCVFYLMMTGVPAFQAPTPLLTALKRLSEDPKPPHEIVPDIPPDIEAVILRCLRRDPQERFRSMLDVLTALGLDATRDSTANLPRPEILDRSRPAGRAEVPRMAALVGLALAAAVGISGLWFSFPGRDPGPRPPQTVEAQRPSSSSAHPQLYRLAGKETHAMLEAGLKTLGLSVISTPEGSPLAANHSDEVLSSQLEPGPRGTRVRLERRNAEGLIRATSFELPREGGEEGERLRLQAALAALYAELPRAAAADQLELARLSAMVSSPPADPDFSWVGLHENIIRVRQRLCEAELPTCLDALLLDARMARFLWNRNVDEEYLRNALELAKEAGRRYPSDPRPLVAEVEIALRSKSTQNAVAILEEHQGSAWSRLHLDLSRLSGSCDAIVEAVASMRQLGGYGARRHGHLLARLLIDAQCVPEARENLRQLLDQDPNNSAALEYLAELDLRGGDIARSAATYERLAGELHGARLQTVRTNLGVARLYLHQFEEASQVFEALHRDFPEDAPVLLNSADALKLAGRTEEANQRYEQLVRKLEKEPRPLDAMVLRAQALAHLGRYEEARSCLGPALQKEPANIKVLSAAALVEAQAGQKAQARAYVQKAIERGVPAAWFDLPFYL